MAKDRTKARIYGDLTSGVYAAPKGTTGPTTLAAPAVAFVEVGWLGEDGVDLDRNDDVATFTAWQGGTILRRKTTSVEDTFKFIANEENLTVLGLYYKGATKTTASSVDSFAITNQTKSDERAWVVDFVDDTVTKRLVVPSGEVTGRATISHKNSDMTVYELTVTIYGDYTILKTAEV